MAERDLKTLLSSLQIKRRGGIWRFETIPAEASSWTDLVTLQSARDIAMLFREDEGLTVILRAEDKTPVDNQWAWLELSVYSDLQAVGFLAAVSSALAEADIPCNAVAAYHHDHLFVPTGKADAAIAALEGLSASA
ncbi:MAG: ACT domain-containing protein [Pseudomonadota bacterium]